MWPFSFKNNAQMLIDQVNRHVRQPQFAPCSWAVFFPSMLSLKATTLWSYCTVGVWPRSGRWTLNDSELWEGAGCKTTSSSSCWKAADRRRPLNSNSRKHLSHLSLKHNNTPIESEITVPFAAIIFISPAEQHSGESVLWIHTIIILPRRILSVWQNCLATGHHVIHPIFPLHSSFFLVHPYGVDEWSEDP